MDAIILGGGTLKGLQHNGTSSKALIQIENKPMVEYLIDTLHETSFISKIVAIVPLSAQYENWAPKVHKVLNADDSFIENVRSGLEYLENVPGGCSDRVMVASCDIPLITAKVVEDFVDLCSTIDAEIIYPIIPRDVVERRYPETKRTYAKMKEGYFTGGNIMLVRPSAVLKNYELVKKAYALRKSPLKLSRELGPKFIMKFLTNSLSVTEAEERVGELLNAKSRAVIIPHPEIGIDVDKVEDLELIQKILRTPGRRSQSPN